MYVANSSVLNTNLISFFDYVFSLKLKTIVNNHGFNLKKFKTIVTNYSFDEDTLVWTIFSKTLLDWYFFLKMYYFGRKLLFLPLYIFICFHFHARFNYYLLLQIHSETCIHILYF